MPTTSPAWMRDFQALTTSDSPSKARTPSSSIFWTTSAGGAPPAPSGLGSRTRTTRTFSSAVPGVLLRAGTRAPANGAADATFRKSLRVIRLLIMVPFLLASSVSRRRPGGPPPPSPFSRRTRWRRTGPGPAGSSMSRPRFSRPSLRRASGMIGPGERCPGRRRGSGIGVGDDEKPAPTALIVVGRQDRVGPLVQEKDIFVGDEKSGS